MEILYHARGPPHPALTQSFGIVVSSAQHDLREKPTRPSPRAPKEHRSVKPRVAAQPLPWVPRPSGCTTLQGLFQRRSIPHVSLVPFDVVPLQQSAVLVLKILRSMMRFLIRDVSLHFTQFGLANREVAVAALPLKISVRRPLIFQPQIRRAF